MKSKFYASFYIAGFTYWDGLDVFDKLKLGTELRLKAEPKNAYDGNAVMILYKDVKLGYVPRSCNEDISKFLRLKYSDLFRVQINRISPEAHPEKQISVVVKINKRQTRDREYPILEE